MVKIALVTATILIVLITIHIAVTIEVVTNC